MAQNSLLSPGIQVTVEDQSNYSSNAQGTVPFILMATAQDKSNAAGSLAIGTAKVNANTLYNVGDQRSLANLFGSPIFPTDASGNRIYGDERSEYGLWAAHNILGAISSAYVMRADVDLSELEPKEARPHNPAAGGTLWLDSNTSEWGIFEWNLGTLSFDRKVPAFLYTADNLSGDMPAPTFGKIGDYAVVAFENPYNPVYYKNYMNEWKLVGSTAWQGTVPTVQAANAGVTNITPSDAIVINGIGITSSTATAAGLVGDIGTLVPGVTVAIVNGKFTLFADSTAMSNGTDADGKVNLSNDGSGTILTKLGISEGVYTAPVLTFSKHSNIPQWKPSMAIPHPPAAGSVWVKTTAYNHGANLTTYRKNSVSGTWDTVANPLYLNDAVANFGLDPSRGGTGIARGTLYTEYDILNNNTLSYATLTRLVSGPTIVTGTTSNATLNPGDTFTIKASHIGSTAWTDSVEIEVLSGPNNTVAKVVEAIAAADIANVEAGITANGNIIITHTAGGTIVLENTSGDALTALGLTTDVINIRDNNDGSVSLSNWVLPGNLPASIRLHESPEEPTTEPVDGSLWFYSGNLEVDIMINENNVWRGYRNVEVDARGYDLTMTDINGPIIAFSKPTMNSTGGSLVYGDLWIDTSDMDNYPGMWRWESKGGIDQWVALDVANATTESGVVFADARWDGDGMVNVLTDDLPMIADLLTNDAIDLDAPDADLYPNGCLLFNTRRSSGNVKRYVENYFTQDMFPLMELPVVQATWESYSGKAYNGVSYFGRRAVRNVVVSALTAAIENSVELTEEGKNFNLIACPGYPELLTSMKKLNDDRKNTGFVIGEVPMGLSTDQTTVERYITDATGVGTTDEFGITINDPYTAVFYPGAATVNSLDGVGSVAIPMSAAILRTIILSDQNSEVWFAPAGNTRGTVDVLSIGHIDRKNYNSFVKTGTPQGIRDLLYPNKVNPVIYLPQVGYVNYGNHTRQASNTALDRINVARLTSYIRARLEITIRPFIFEPNDKITRDTVKRVCEGLLNDLIARRGVYDYIVICDRTNNSNAQIDRNELHVDIAIEPVKAVEFIYIPIRLKGTGQIASGNITPSTPLG